MGKLFGTDGIRGIANKELTPELAFKLGRSAAYIVMSEKKQKPTFFIGTDTRISKDMLSSAISAGICSVGGKAVFLGVVPTPGIAYLTRTNNADAGVVISASHNSYEYNGIKFFNHFGLKLSDEAENNIEDLILAERDEIPTYINSDIGTVQIDGEILKSYEGFLDTAIDTDLKGLKVILDCANGAAYDIAPKVIKRAGASVFLINSEPDGTNINKECGSTNIENLKKRLETSKYDCALSLDGDADRLLMLDEKGDIVDGDQIMAIIALQLKEENKLSNNTFVATVMSNMGLNIMARKNGIDLVQTKVGDRYVLEEMLKKGHILGGEKSGHIILLEKNTTGDGILTALQILQIMKKKKQKLSELTSIIEILPQVLLGAKVTNSKKNYFNEDEVIFSKCSELERQLDGVGRLLVRSSGTEPLVRVMIEGMDINYITEKAKELVEIIEKRMN